MLDSKDWLQDPFVTVEKSLYEWGNPRGLDGRLRDLWQTFHFCTRLKLEGAEHFCRQVLGAASMPNDLGLPLLAHRQLKWYLDAFFFELMAAFDTLLQELNVVYLREAALDLARVRWGNELKKELPAELVKLVNDGYQSEWFDKIRRYRNTATHHAYVPTGSSQTGSGDKPLDYDEHETYMYCIAEDRKNFEQEDISACREYLHSMVRFIGEAWAKLATDFPVS